MKISHIKLLTKMIGDLVKIITSLLVIYANIYLCIIAHNGKAVEMSDKSLAYRLCSLVWNDATYKAAIKDKGNKTAELTKSVDAEIKTQSIDTLCDIPLNESQRQLSLQIEDRNRKIRNMYDSQDIVRGWIYVGSMDKKTSSWLTKYFPFDEDMPVIKSQYYADKAINLRDSAPNYDSGNWSKGKIIGGLFDGDSFIIEEISFIPGTNNRSLIWARISR